MSRESWSDEEQPELEVEITLREVEGENPPNAMRSALSAARDALPKLVESARLWAHAKALQEVGKAAELRHNLVREAARLELEREQMIAERAARREEEENKRVVAEAEAVKLRAEAVRAVAEAAQRLRAAGLSSADVIAIMGRYSVTLGVSAGVEGEDR